MTTEATSTNLRAGTDPAPDRAAANAAPSRSAGLLSLVRNLIAFGQALLHTLHSSPPVAVFTDIARGFGTRDFAVIVARITRALMLASALDERLVHAASRLDAPPARPAAVRTTDSAPRRKWTARTPAITQEANDAALLAGLPTAQDIAARLRGKPIGVVLEEICHDLGITCDHKLWQALNLAIICNGGRLVGLYKSVRRRLAAFMPVPPDTLLVYPQPAVAQTGTGPP